MKTKWISISIAGALVLGVISCGGSTLETDLAVAEYKVSTLETDLAAAEADSAIVVFFPDTVLKHLIRDTLGISDPLAPFYASDLETITTLDSGTIRWITDLTGLEYCINLSAATFWLETVDLSPLTGLSNLEQLSLRDSSELWDLSPLLSNAGLGSGDTVWVEGCPLSYGALYTTIPLLKARGVKVHR